MVESEFRLNLRRNAEGGVRDAGIIYWADLFMGFATGFVVIYNLRRRVIRRPVSIAEYYVRYGTFWPDFLASLPTIAEVRPCQALDPSLWSDVSSEAAACNWDCVAAICVACDRRYNAGHCQGRM